ncbi:Acyltransferase family protein [Glycomyces sambucus]|uniref:Acyltransferase family protein n=1 Tax=Glycomyces sambucus TaxID=380244 RepID=A0A1G9FXZ2_9ACTN|nr:acyltransferase family protein [Glycomyces sambucus]SDK93185.1 Acyltransferase family protein [Glycomyces sambucus]
MTTATAPPLAPATGRLHHLDNLRVYLTFLVVAHHVALGYGNLGIWPNWEEPENAAGALPLDVFVLFNQAYTMGLFFLLSGAFAPPALDRRGPGPYARERLRRLGIPFLAFLILLRPLYTLPEYLGRPADERGPYWQYYLTESNIGPMWFVEVLLVFSLLYAWFRAVRPAPEPAPPQSLRPWHFAAFAVALALVSWVWRMAVPVGQFVPVLGLPSAAYLPQYVAVFCLGALAFRRGWLANLPRRAGLLGVGLILASLLAMAFSGYAALDLEDPPPAVSTAHLGFALWDSLFAVGAILILLRGFERFANGSGPLARFLSANAYGVYLVHAPVIVGAVALLAPVAAPPVVKFLLAFAVAAPVSWAATAALRRIPAVRSVL